MRESSDFTHLRFSTLNERLAFLSELQDTLMIGIAISDDQGRLLHLNRGFCAYLGMSANELLGRCLSELMVEDERERAAAAIVDCLQNRGPAVTQEWRFNHADGVVCWLEVLPQPFTFHSDLSLCLWTFIDITERKKWEQDAGNRVKKESLALLADGVAHRFNDQLTSILGYTDLALALLPPNSNVEVWLGEVRKAALQSAELTKQLLAYNSKGYFILERINLSELIKEAIADLPQDISPRIQLRPDLPLIEGDKDRLRQLFFDLINNANDANQGSGTITVRTDVRLIEHPASFCRFADADRAGGTFVCLEIEDTGCGIDADKLDRIFDPFYSTKFHGRGMGLAAAQGLVRALGGFMNVKSEIGNGSVFQAFFPIVS